MATTFEAAKIPFRHCSPDRLVSTAGSRGGETGQGLACFDNTGDL